MEAIVKQFSYKGNSVSFDLSSGKEMMVNATEMAKTFGKLPGEWLRLPSTKAFLEALTDTGKSLNVDSLVVTERGGLTGGGTWMHEDVALEFARWLNPSFAIWCNDRIKELMRHGATAINPESLLDPDFIINLANALKQEREAKAMLMVENEKQRTVIHEQAPKVEYCDRVLQSQGVMATTQVAADCGVSAIKLNRFLFDILGWQHKVNGTWVPSAKIKSRDYMRSKTFVFVDERGIERSEQLFYWTQRGRAAVMEEVRKYRGKNLVNALI